MNLNNIHSIYFIGIGGIGMSALAKYMLSLGKDVGGYDATPSPITQSLSEAGAYIQFDDSLDLTLDQYLLEDCLVVYTPAIKREENTLLNFYLTSDFTVIKRAKLLGEVTKNSICLAVAGTHGKTTTSSMLGHILKEAGYSVTAFLGGISENYHSNLILSGNQYTVVEADEFDRSFLQLDPDYSCITSTDADHLDIYDNQNNMLQSFKQFADLTKKKVFVKKGLAIKGVTYALGEEADIVGENIRIENETYYFDIHTPEESLQNLQLSLPGKYNVFNAVGAIALAQVVGVPLKKSAQALASYKGVERRFSYRINNKKYVLIDDYAHHPTEIQAYFEAVNEMYPQEEKLVIFQPHLYSRTKDFENAFVKILAKFDKILLLPIYPAREKPIKGVTSKALVNKIQKLNTNVSLIQPDEIVSKIKGYNIRLISMLGAGSIGEMIKDVTKQLLEESI